jgi:hypothetical protein
LFQVSSFQTHTVGATLCDHGKCYCQIMLLCLCGFSKSTQMWKLASSMEKGIWLSIAYCDQIWFVPLGGATVLFYLILLNGHLNVFHSNFFFFCMKYSISTYIGKCASLISIYNTRVFWGILILCSSGFFKH